MKYLDRGSSTSQHFYIHNLEREFISTIQYTIPYSSIPTILEKVTLASFCVNSDIAEVDGYEVK